MNLYAIIYHSCVAPGEGNLYMIPILFNLINTFVNAAENEVHSSFVLWILSTLSSVFSHNASCQVRSATGRNLGKNHFMEFFNSPHWLCPNLRLHTLTKNILLKKKIYGNHISGQNSLISMKMLLKTKEKKIFIL